MEKKARGGSLSSRGLRQKIFVAVSLMSFIPLLIMIYLFANFIAPNTVGPGVLTLVTLMIALTVGLSLLGLTVVNNIVNPVIKMSEGARAIARGDFKHSVDVSGEDEVGELGNSINLMTKRIRESLLELQSYSARTKEVNIDIQKKVIILSSLLQISDMIAASESLKKICDTVAHKVSEIEEESFAALFLADDGGVNMELKAHSNIRGRHIKGASFFLDKEYIGASVSGKMSIMKDSSVGDNPQLDSICGQFNAKNFLIIPVISHGESLGFLLTGNDHEGYMFPGEDIELVKVLARQLGIAIENAALQKKARELVIRDELTGLYNEKYITERLDEEIERSIMYQRPCALLLFNIDDFRKFRDSHGEMATEEALKRIAGVLAQSSRGVNKAARLGGDEFAVVLSDSNKKQAAALAESLRKKVESLGMRIAGTGEKALTISGAVSENPIDGSSASELLSKASSLMEEAKSGGKNRIAA